MQDFWRDIRFAWRNLRKQPGFALVAVLTLALGIGANTALFSVVYAVLLRPLPYPAPEQLVRIWETNEAKGSAREMTSLSNLLDWRARNQSLQEIAAWQRPNSVTLTGLTPAVELLAGTVTTNFFAVLGTQPVLGRTFVNEEGLPGRTRVVVLSHSLWQRQFGANPHVVGQKLQLERIDFQVVGVMPAGFQSPAGEAELWLPIELTPNAIDRGQTYLQAIARLKPGVRLEQAQADTTSVAAELARQFPASNRGRGIAVMPLLQATVGAARSTILIVFGAVLCVLLIACANVANLFLARAAGRERELAVRAALGASRGRIIQQLLTESILVYITGGALGVLGAYGLVYLLQQFSPSNLPRLAEIGVDTTALLFTSAVTLLTGFLFGLAPAYQLSTPDLNRSLKAGKQSSVTGKQRLRDAFLIVQLAFALVLLCGAGLLVKSYWRLSQVPPGFEPHNLLVVRLGLDDEYRADQRQVTYFRELTQRLKALPGVTTAGAATVTPLNSYGIDFDVPWYRTGEPEPQRTNAAKARFRSTTPDYFQTLAVPLLRGRWFSERDELTAPRVVLVNQALAERAWPGQDPVGQRLRFFWADWQSYEVVGVVGNTKSYGLAEDWCPELFVPHAQIPYTVMNVVVRTTGEPAQLAAAIRRVLQDLDASQPPHSIVTLDEVLATTLARERFALVLLQALAGLALLLAIIGLYGVLTYVAAQRTHEIGIRTALGATPSNVLKLLLGQGLKLALSGVGVGLICASALTRALQSLLFGVSTTDPLTFVVVTALLVLAALLACWRPAWRAARVDPLLALRQE